MSKILLLESIVLNSGNQDDIKKRTDIFESLDNGKILVENNEMGCLGVYRTTISRIGIKNKNGRTYNEDTWKQPLNNGEGEGSIGLVNHPKQGESPDLKNSFCIWKNHKIEIASDHKPVVRADMYILNNDNGKLINSILEASGRVELSTRGYGELNEDGTVRDFSYKSCDSVYEGSFSVDFGKDEEIRDTVAETAKTDDTQVTEEVKGDTKITEDAPEYQTNTKIEPKTTNNKIETGEIMMDKVVINRLINESLKRENKFTAYKELQDLSESVNGKDEYKDIQETIQKHLTELTPLLEKEYQGDAKDKGSAGEPATRVHNATDPEKKIKDTDEKEPDDIKKVQVEPVKDTPDSERDGKTGIKAASSPDSMKSEVESGEVSTSSQKVVKEDTKETPPDDVDKIEVEPTDDTKKRTAYTDTKAGTGKAAETPEDEKGEEEVEKIEHVDLDKLSKEELKELATKMNDAIKMIQEDLDHEKTLFDVLSEQYLKMETYTMKAEEVVESDKNNKETAQGEVTESVKILKEAKDSQQELQKIIEKKEEYIQKLEDILVEYEKKVADKEDVTPYVESFLASNRTLEPYRKDLMKAESVQEVLEIAEQKNSLRGKVRLDRVITEDHVEEKEEITEGASYLKVKNWM